MCEIFNEIKVYTYHFFECNSSIDQYWLTPFINYFVCPLLVVLIGGFLVKHILRKKYKIQYSGSMIEQGQNIHVVSVEIENIGNLQLTDASAHIILDDSCTIKQREILDIDNLATLGIDKNEYENLPTYMDEGLKLSASLRAAWMNTTNFLSENQFFTCWDFSGDPYKINLKPFSRMRLIICKAIEYDVGAKKFRYWYYIFPTERGWRRVRFRMTAKTLTGRIILSFSNSYPLIIPFKINHDSESSTPKLEITSQKVVLSEPSQS